MLIYCSTSTFTLCCRKFIEVVPTLCSEFVGCISCVELLCLIVVQDFEKLRKFFSANFVAVELCSWIVSGIFFLPFNFFLQWWKIFWLLQQIQYKINIYIKICTDLTVLQLIGFLKRYFIKTMDIFFRSNYLLSSLCIKTSWIGH